MSEEGGTHRLGEILVENGYTEPEHVDEALKVQGRPGEKRMIGQIMLSRGHVKRHHIDVALAKQRAMQQKK
jgi:hypothetical protein